MEEIKETLEQIKKILIQEFNPLAIVVYGSYSRNSQNSESDIDIAIKAKNVDSKKLFKVKQQLEEIASKDIDLISLDNVESETLRYEVLMTGITIYCTDSYKFDMYKLDMFREYYDYKEGIKDIIDRVKEGGTIYGK